MSIRAHFPHALPVLRTAHHMNPAIWLAFFAVIGALAAIDLGLVTRRPRIVTPLEGLASFCLWLVSAMGFSLLVWYVYKHNWLDIERTLAAAVGPLPPDRTGHSAWVHWITAYVVEIALSIDNIAIAALLVRYYKIPAPLIGRTLFWTALVSLVIRWLMILTGAWMLRAIPWVQWAFAAVIVLAMLRTLLAPDEHTDLGRKWAIRTLNRLVPVTADYDGLRLFTRVRGKLRGTPVLMVVLAASIADLTFAADSVPALFSITQDPFLAFSASAFALLGLRSLYLALSGVLIRFRYLRVSLVFVLLAIAGKMLLVSSDQAYFDNRPTLIMLAIVSGIMAIGVVASALRTRPAFAEGEAFRAIRPTPLEDLSGAVDISRRNFRKVVILIVGSAIALVGFVIVGPLPGPGGIPVILLGLTILATEFIWARRLLTRIKTQTKAMAEKADQVAAKTSPWLVPPVVIGVVGGIVALAHLGPFSPVLVYMIGLGPTIAVGYWAWKTFRARKPGPPASASAAPGKAARKARRTPAA